MRCFWAHWFVLNPSFLASCDDFEGRKMLSGASRAGVCLCEWVRGFKSLQNPTEPKPQQHHVARTAARKQLWQEVLFLSAAPELEKWLSDKAGSIQAWQGRDLERAGRGVSGVIYPRLLLYISEHDRGLERWQRSLTPVLGYISW